MTEDELMRLLACCKEPTGSPWSPVRCRAEAWFGTVYGLGLIDALKQAIDGALAPWDRTIILRGWP
jgi:hypothetical protein